MPEVFTLSGASFGASKTGPAGQLQHALKVLGQTTGDSALTKVQVDGVVGTKTVTALNYAFKTYGGSERTDWTVPEVKKAALSLSDIVVSVVRQQGGTVDKPKKKGSSSASAADIIAAQQASKVSAYNAFTENPNLAWWVLGGALVVVSLGFAAAKKRRQREAARVPAPA